MKLPRFIAPMLSKPGSAFDSPDYFFEIKWDGTRVLAFIEDGGYRLVNRRQLDMTERYPEFAFLRGLPPGIIFDGEVVVLKGGKPDFGLLQSREQARTPLKIRTLSQKQTATYLVFDVLYDAYQSQLDKTFVERRKVLQRIVDAARSPLLVVSDGVVGEGKAFFQQTCAGELEGMVAKRLNSRYTPGERSDAWIKVKRGETVACAIIGFLPSGKDDFRSLILASQNETGLHYVGKVGTGFDLVLRKKINGLLWKRLRDKPIIPCKIKGTWIEPGLYCLVHCMERSAEGILRAPAFKQLLDEA